MLTSARRQIQYPNTDRSDRPDVPAHILNLVTALEQDVLFNIGTDASRIAATHQVGGGRFWWATDTSILWFDDGTAWQFIGNAPLASPAFTGTPTAPTAPAATNTTQIATTAFVKSQNYITSVFGRSGAVVAATGDYTVAQVTGAAPLASPAFTGTPTAPTVATADSSTSIATTAWVKAQGYLTAATVVVTSVYGRSGAVTAQTGDYSVAQITGAAPLASPAFTGNPTAPTPPIGDNDTSIATTAFTRTLLPPGVIMPYVGSAAPNAEWLLCSGQAISRSTYAALFAVIGTAYGGGDGSTTFNVPNLQGRVPVGLDTGTFNALGATGGEQTHVLAATEMPSHTHTFTGTALGTHIHNFTGTAMAAHTHTFAGAALPTHNHNFTGVALATHTHNFTGTAMPGHTHAFTGSALAGHSHAFTGNTVPDHHHYQTMSTPNDFRARWDVKVTTGGSSDFITDFDETLGSTSSNFQSWTGMVDFADSSAGAVSGSINSVSAGTPAGTNASVSAGTPAGTNDQQSAGTPSGSIDQQSAGTPSGTNSSVSAGTPAGTLDAQSAGTPAGTNANTGGGGAHNNLQPYVVTNYIIKV